MAVGPFCLGLSCGCIYTQHKALSLMYVPDTPHYYHGVVTLGCVFSSLTLDGEEVPSCEMEEGG